MAATGLSGAREAAGAEAEPRKARFLRNGTKWSVEKSHPDKKNLKIRHFFSFLL